MPVQDKPKPLRVKAIERFGNMSGQSINAVKGKLPVIGFAEHLSDEEVAMVSTYVRNAWGNGFGPVTEEEVAALR